MPIRPENRARYPKDWKAIVAQVRERSGDCCEGSPAFPRCRRPNRCYVVPTTGRTSMDPREALHWEIEGLRVTRVVLTTGHLDHVPENCALSNLRHWCQRCHLHYDREHHAQTAYATRRARARTPDLFEELA